MAKRYSRSMWHNPLILLFLISQHLQSFGLKNDPSSVEVDRDGTVLSNSEEEKDMYQGFIDFGVAQTLSSDTLGKFGGPESIAEVLTKMDHYFRTEILNDPSNADLKKICQNHHEQCVMWASWGECKKNPVYMNSKCAAACRSCHGLRDVKKNNMEEAKKRWATCPVIEGEVDFFGQSGDLNRLFEKIMEYDGDDFRRATVHSHPKSFKGKGADSTVDGPWVVTFDNFLTPEECDHLIKLGAKQGYERSLAGDLVSKTRTSQQSWCSSQECRSDPITQRVSKKIQTVTGDPPLPNFEPFQMLKYDPGQFYASHNDYIQGHQEAPHGSRILTMFLYLNDVEEGGGTRFTNLDIMVMPRKGKALLWPSVLDEKPNDIDERTAHEATPVIAGEKYAANAWLHQRDFRSRLDIACL